MTDMTTFSELGLPAPLLQALDGLGYETPSPIQAATIPSLLEGRDLLGQAQTGTGKTAAFALPLLTRIDYSLNEPQLLVLAPTRELAIQVAEAFQSYASHMKKAKILPIYGGQSYTNQLKQLKQGVQIIVGTPGRVMDHIDRKTLKLDNLKALVLDEADEMLRMGFIDDVEWILKRTPKTRQIALFSATMPKEVKKVAETYLNKPELVKITNKTATANTIRQRYWYVSGLHKLDALTRILEVEEFDGVIVFVRTKVATVELADKMVARGYRCEALNGDIAQNQREQIVDKLKKGKTDILIATDVVARGLDVERISHVINYDIPLDTESYVHRIGRTGRAGRSGEAILFVAPRERRLLNAIERMTKSPMVEMDMPSIDQVNKQRVMSFKERITQVIENKKLEPFSKVVDEYIEETGADAQVVAAALAAICHDHTPLFVTEKPYRESKKPRDRNRDDQGGRDKRKRRDRDGKKRPANDADMESYQISVGRNDGVKPGNIVGAIANEADISSKFIGHIKISDSHSTVDLPKGLSKDVIKKLQKTYICGKPAQLKRQS